MVGCCRYGGVAQGMVGWCRVWWSGAGYDKVWWGGAGYSAVGQGLVGLVRVEYVRMRLRVMG